MLRPLVTVHCKVEWSKSLDHNIKKLQCSEKKKKICCFVLLCVISMNEFIHLVMWDLRAIQVVYRSKMKPNTQKIYYANYVSWNVSYRMIIYRYLMDYEGFAIMISHIPICIYLSHVLTLNLIFRNLV